MKPLSRSDRALLAGLVERLAVQFWYERHGSDGLRFLAGAAATVRVNGGRMTVYLRPTASVQAEPHRQALLSLGVLELLDGELLVSRLPEGREIMTFREMAGLSAAWGGPPPASARSA